MRINTTLPKATLRSAGTVAVVITTYNHAEFLEEAIRSAIRQSVPPNEIIVVDDGSTDHPDVVVSRYSLVRLIRQPNEGLSSARNTGLRVAISDKVIFLDADDRLCRCAIEAGLECFLGHPDAGLIYGGYRVFNAGGVFEEWIPGDFGPDPHLAFLRGNFIGMTGTVLFDRKRLLDAGGFDVTLLRCEDYDIFLRMSRIHPVANHRRMVAEYRRHGSNMSLDSLEMLVWVQRVLERYKPHNKSGPAAKAWRRGLAGWRSYYIPAFLWGEPVKEKRRPLIERITKAMRLSPSTTVLQLIRRCLQRALSPRLQLMLKRWLGMRPPPPLKLVRFGDFDRTDPISADFGFNRGTPVDRYYIEAFLASHSQDIRGRTLEVRDSTYCCKFGKGVVQQDVIDIQSHNPYATIVGDLAIRGTLPEEAFDCLVVTQTLQFIYDMHAALAEMYRALKPGGVLLFTCPGISQIERGDAGESWFWSVTRAAAERMFSELFGAANVAVEVRGNVYAAICFLQGLALEEVDIAKLDVLDESYPVIVAVRAQKLEEA
jgi:glycosyltransferase involved in cell wall biosynthesis/SAM-dependent methyltransferase